METFYASVLLSLAHTHLHLCLWLYCVWMCRQPSLSSIIHLWRLFNSRRSPACLFPPRVALCSSRLSLSCFFLLHFSFPPLFTLMSAFLSCLKTFHPLLHPPPLTHHQPSLFTSPPILRRPISARGLTRNGCVSPPFPCLLLLPSKLCFTIALPTKQSPLMSGRPVGIGVLLLIIGFAGNPHHLALP